MLLAICAVIGAGALIFLPLLLATLIFGLVFRRTKVGGHALAYALAILLGIDVTANAILAGRAYSTISCRVGESIRDGGWAAEVHWPAWWRAHCAAAIHPAIV